MVAVIDVDCKVENGFDEDDRVWLERLAELLAGACEWGLGEKENGVEHGVVDVDVDEVQVGQRKRRRSSARLVRKAELGREESKDDL